MKYFKPVFFLLITILCIYFLDNPIHTKDKDLPRIGFFFSPFQGFWQNAESKNSINEVNIKSNLLKDNANVWFDDRLVPHIYAKNDDDAYFIQGFLHAKNRLWQMDFQTQAAGGRLSELFGNKTLEKDRFFRRIGMVYAAENHLKYIEDNNPTAFTILNAYCNGVNAYIKSLNPAQFPLEYKLLNYKPSEWTNLKTCLFFSLMCFDLSGRSFLNDLQLTNSAQFFDPTTFNNLYNNPILEEPIIPINTPFKTPAVKVIDPLKNNGLKNNSSQKNIPNISDINIPLPNENNGSNNWAVAGSKTKSGKPILCSDPHLGLNLPSLWYEMQISTPTSNVYGASFAGAPTIVIGFNDSIAWGVTNAGRDVLDFYELKCKDTTLQEYWYNNQWVKSTPRKEIIHIKNEPDLIENLAITNQGLIMYDQNFQDKNSNGKTLAVRWTGHFPKNSLQALIGLNKAKNMQDYFNAINNWVVPGQNFVFASHSGDIAIKQQGQFIARYKNQGDIIMDGQDSTYQWQGYIPTDENPTLINPARGFVSSANQPATDYTYPYYLGNPNLFPIFRGEIINRKLNAMNNITCLDMKLLQTNNYNIFAEKVTPILINNLLKNTLSSKQKKYLTILQNWDFVNMYKSAGALIFQYFWDSLKNNIFKDEFKNAPNKLMPINDAYLYSRLKLDSNFLFVDDIFTTAKESLPYILLTTLNNLIPVFEDLENKGNLGWLMNKGTPINYLLNGLPAFSKTIFPLGGNRYAINAIHESHGPSWRMIVHLSNPIEAYCIYPGGQSGNPGSYYYDNFIDDWGHAKYYAIIFDKEENIISNNHIISHYLFTKS